MSDAVSIIDGLDLVVSLADGHLHPDDLGAARHSAAEARSRVGHLGSTLVAALLGGTGAGKSSLLNALAGEPIAPTSRVRPHTSEPLAWVPESAEPGLSALLDRLGIELRVPQSRLPGIALIDMTDTDSIEESHRRRVNSVLPEIDVGLWVLDPLKYADSALHHEFLRPLAPAADRMIFVLNQIDRIPLSDGASVREHLGELLGHDGYEAPVIVGTAAAPDHGPRLGIDGLRSLLAERLDEKRIHLSRIVEEARAAARRLGDAAGVSGGSSVDFEERWRLVRIQGAALLGAEGAGIVEREEALLTLERFVGRLSAETGGPFGATIRSRFRPERIEEAILDTVAAAGVSADRQAVVETGLEERIGAPLRKLLWQRASLAAAVAGMAVAAETAGAGLGIDSGQAG